MCVLQMSSSQPPPYTAFQADVDTVYTTAPPNAFIPAAATTVNATTVAAAAAAAIPTRPVAQQQQRAPAYKRSTPRNTASAAAPLIRPHIVITSFFDTISLLERTSNN